MLILRSSSDILWHFINSKFGGKLHDCHININDDKKKKRTWEQLWHTDRQSPSYGVKYIYIYGFLGFFLFRLTCFQTDLLLSINKIEIDFKFPSLSKSYIKFVFFRECFMLHVASVIQFFFQSSLLTVYLDQNYFYHNFSIMKSIHTCCLYLSLCLEIFLNYYGNTMEFYFLVYSKERYRLLM